MPKDGNQKNKYFALSNRRPSSERQINSLQSFQLLIKEQTSNFDRSPSHSSKQSMPELNGRSFRKMMPSEGCLNSKFSESQTQKSTADSNLIPRSNKFNRIKSRGILSQLVSPAVDSFPSNRLQLTKQDSFGQFLPASVEKISLISQKAKQCKKLCLEIKQKLFQETASTITSDLQQGRRSQLSIADFKLDALLAKEQNYEIYRALHKYTGMVLAIKVISKQTVKRQKLKEQIERQIKIQSYFRNPNILHLYAFMHDQANIYLVMEYCSGQRLSHIFKINSKFKEEDLAPIIKGVCKGLLELHSHNVIYRSLKADNVMLSFGVPKLTNFGQSVFNPNQYRQTYCGTPLEIYPNLVMENACVKQDDVWALGVLIYEFLTGNMLSREDHDNRILEMVDSQVVYPQHLSQCCLTLLHSMLGKTSPHPHISDILKHPFMAKIPAQISIHFAVRQP